MTSLVEELSRELHGIRRDVHGLRQDVKGLQGAFMQLVKFDEWRTQHEKVTDSILHRLARVETRVSGVEVDNAGAHAALNVRADGSEWLIRAALGVAGSVAGGVLVYVVTAL